MEQDIVAALLAFPPVPVRARRDGWTPRRQQRFVLALAYSGSAAAAARMVGMTVQGAARLRRRPDAKGFDRACRFALDLGRTRRCVGAIQRERCRSREAARRRRAKVREARNFSPLGAEITAPSETSASRSPGRDPL